MFKYIFILIGLWSLGGSSFAGYDAPCKTIKLTAEKQNIILNNDHKNKAGKLYFIQNIFGENIWLNHPSTQHGVNAGWASFLRNRYWSALFLTRPNFVVSCTQLTHGKVNYLNCGSALRACEIPYGATKKITGNYWVVQNQEYSMLAAGAKARGFKTK